MTLVANVDSILEMQTQPPIREHRKGLPIRGMSDSSGLIGWRVFGRWLYGMMAMIGPCIPTSCSLWRHGLGFPLHHVFRLLWSATGGYQDEVTAWGGGSHAHRFCGDFRHDSSRTHGRSGTQVPTRRARARFASQYKRLRARTRQSSLPAPSSAVSSLLSPPRQQPSSTSIWTSTPSRGRT